MTDVITVSLLLLFDPVFRGYIDCSLISKCDCVCSLENPENIILMSEVSYFYASHIVTVDVLK